MAEGADKLRKLLADPTITEIMVNGPSATWLEVKGTKYKIDVTFSEEDLKDIIDIFFNFGCCKIIAHVYSSIKKSFRKHVSTGY